MRKRQSDRLDDTVKAVDWIQRQCYEVYIEVASLLKTGMREVDIEVKVAGELKKRGLTDFWYDIPIMVLIGPKRFLSMADPDYEKKRPSDKVVLKRGDTIFIDMHPRDENGLWGDFSATAVFKPKDKDQQAVDFLRLVLSIHRQGIVSIKPNMTGGDLTRWYLRRLEQKGIILHDARDTVGHSMHKGDKKDIEGQDKRLFLDEKNTAGLAGRIWAIEPGGYNRSKNSNQILVGRFEDCLYVSKKGKARILGSSAKVPIVFN